MDFLWWIVNNAYNIGWDANNKQDRAWGKKKKLSLVEKAKKRIKDDHTLL